MPGINLGTATNFAKELRDSSDFRQFVEHFGDLAQRRMQDSLESPPDRRQDQTGYARALLDVWTALEAVMKNVQQAQVRNAPVVDQQNGKSAPVSDEPRAGRGRGAST